MQLGELAGERQAEAGAAMTARQHRLDLLEGADDACDVLRRDADDAGAPATRTRMPCVGSGSTLSVTLAALAA